MRKRTNKNLVMAPPSHEKGLAKSRVMLGLREILVTIWRVGTVASISIHNMPGSGLLTKVGTFEGCLVAATKRIVIRGPLPAFILSLLRRASVNQFKVESRPCFLHFCGGLRGRSVRRTRRFLALYNWLVS